MDRGNIIIALDSGEAEIISKNSIARQYKILTLSPGATAVFKTLGGLDTIDTTAVYSDCAHARSVVNQKNIQDEFRRLAKKNDLSEIQIAAAANVLFYMSGTASFYYQVLRRYDKFYIVNAKKLEEVSGFENAFMLIISRIFEKRYGGREHEFSALHLWLMKRHNASLMRKLRGRRKIVSIDGARPSSRNFAREAIKIEPQLAVISGHAPMKSIRAALRQMQKPGHVYFLYPAKTREYKIEADNIAAKAETAFSRLLFKAAANYLAKVLQFTAAYEKEAANHVNNLRPAIITTDDVSRPFTLSLCKHARMADVPVMLFNHASHTPQNSAISGAIGNLWASFGVVSSPYASHIAARSPAVAKLSKQIDGNGNVIGVRHDEKIALKSHKKFKILFAGNYLGVQDHVPWILETPDEFIKGITELAAAVAQIPEAELTIRVKPGKKDLNPEILKQLTPQYLNVAISNSGTLKEVLAETDLMVAGISSTVDEALQSERPLLLHSWPKRYQHLPTGGAVYASRRGESLVELLRKIISTHKKEADLTPYIWPQSEPDMAGLAKRILEL